ncbi:MAG TPA: PilZ domain-containing protein [Pyrinomonadaceae bacterium]
MSNQTWQPRDFSERRGAPRTRAELEARLAFSVYAQGGPSQATERDRQQVAGHTRNISETGLALVVPSIRCGGQFFNVVGQELDITLELPTEPVQVQASTVRCERLDGRGAEKGYLVGVRITEMSDKEWVRLVQYVRSLR